MTGTGTAAPAAPRASHPFLGRSLAVIGDLNREERLYLYRRARELKEAHHREDRAALDSFRINDPDFGIYEVFLEDSTRTRESFKNAAHFHRLKFSELNAASSSFNKSESYADTFANLVGYDNRMFVIRSRLEGVCRYLAEKTEAYLRRHGISRGVSFINAGDGRHEHPTQELLDEFTFLEDLHWDDREIHLALVGDLYHGRTVHSKVHGLGLFHRVRVDLVAPPELSMPLPYVQQMEDQGFQVRQYASIAEYLEQGRAGTDGVARLWYFTRPQLERMGERVLRRAAELRGAITFDPADIGRLPEGTFFYHPLPRHREHPTIPVALDDTSLNGWERQSANGWYVRMVLLAMLAGRIGEDYRGPVGPDRLEEEDFVREVTGGSPGDGKGDPGGSGNRGRRFSEGIRPIRDGLVIDHIFAGAPPEKIRSHLTTLISVMGLHGRGGEWISTGEDGRHKGLLFRPGHPGLDEGAVRKLAAVIPGATVNVIGGGRVQRKFRLGHPRRVYGLPELICRNEACITHPDNGEQTLPRFSRSRDGYYICDYCSHKYEFTEVWL
ncbi:MAG: aspartate carbamoyltransferase [Spirochaetaceae bacterium]|nr:MAG: aspartate carbamoyltransferase [Spirochaetaceae bacterium]